MTLLGSKERVVALARLGNPKRGYNKTPFLLLLLQAFSFFALFIYIGLAVFIVVGGLVLKWNPTTAKYDTGSGGGEAGGE